MMPSFKFDMDSRVQKIGAQASAHRQVARVAACMLGCISMGSHAASTCVHDAVELQAALHEVSTAGSSNTTDNTILLASGTYATGGAIFNFTTASGYALTVEGGYDSTCTTQDPTPGMSMLDGGNADLVLAVQTNGTFALRHVTIQNGHRSGADGGGAQIYMSDPAAAVLFENNVVRNNSSDYAVGGVVIFGSGSVTHVDNNLFVGNSAPAASALFTDAGIGSTNYITNNTITGNSCSNMNCSTTSIGTPAGPTADFVSNNISYANTATYDFFVYNDLSVQFTNNDYASMDGVPATSSSGNLNIDPKFVGAGDYHLAPDSPLLDAGVLAPPGGLADTDIEGYARSIAGKVDVGAYEHGDSIFTDGFDG